jgi:membrane associated rhomboid family serine protease
MATLEKEFWQFLTHIKIPILLICLMWIAHIYNESVGNIYNSWGIYPREIDGLVGVLAAPFLHSGYHHLISNSAPMLVLTTIMTMFYRRVAVASFVLIYLLAGLLVWIFGNEAYHIGASGVVYGLVAFVFWIGIFRRNTRSIVLSLIIIVMYSGYIAGILPDQPGISWESHLLGGLVGILVAYIFKDVLEPDEIEKDIYADEVEIKSFYFPRDVFDKTKVQKQQEAMLREQQLRELQQRRRLGGWESDNTYN